MLSSLGNSDLTSVCSSNPISQNYISVTIGRTILASYLVSRDPQTWPLSLSDTDYIKELCLQLVSVVYLCQRSKQLWMKGTILFLIKSLIDHCTVCQYECSLRIGTKMKMMVHWTLQLCRLLWPEFNHTIHIMCAQCLTAFGVMSPVFHVGFGRSWSNRTMDMILYKDGTLFPAGNWICLRVCVCVGALSSSVYKKDGLC